MAVGSTCCAETAKDHSSVSLDGDRARSRGLGDDARGNCNNLGEACDEVLPKVSWGRLRDSEAAQDIPGRGLGR